MGSNENRESVPVDGDLWEQALKHIFRLSQLEESLSENQERLRETDKEFNVCRLTWGGLARKPVLYTALKSELKQLRALIFMIEFELEDLQQKLDVIRGVLPHRKRLVFERLVAVVMYGDDADACTDRINDLRQEFYSIGVVPPNKLPAPSPVPNPDGSRRLLRIVGKPDKDS